MVATFVELSPALCVVAVTPSASTEVAVTLPVKSPVTSPVKLPIKVEATNDSKPTVHLLFVSSHMRVTLESSPLSISIPASTVAEPVALDRKSVV